MLVRLSIQHQQPNRYQFLARGLVQVIAMPFQSESKEAKNCTSLGYALSLLDKLKNQQMEIGVKYDKRRLITGWDFR